MAIANPSQDLLMHAAFASDLLMNRPGSDLRYIERMNAIKEQQNGENVQAAVVLTPGEKIFEAVMKGSQGSILTLVKEGLEAGLVPDDIIQKHLIAAIQKVGQLFEEKKYFLPQLIASAETMEKAIGYLEPMLKKDDAEEKATIIMATVEGDIHDIGKNLVVLMLKNYGYRVIDLGKDVAADRIVAAAIKEHAAIIGLSALMTTTMMRMRDVVELVHEKNCDSQVIIGGAVTTQSFADEIGADGYSRDAADAVHLVERLLKTQEG